MIYKLTQDIWFGDKPSIAEGVNDVSSVLNVCDKIAQPYWRHVSQLGYHVWYFKMALPNEVVPDETYYEGLERLLSLIDDVDKYPLLIHSRKGDLRAPAVALFAYWQLHERTVKAKEEGLTKVTRLQPAFSGVTKRCKYRHNMIDYMIRSSLV